MTDTTRRIRETSTVIEGAIPDGMTLDEYRRSRQRASRRGDAASVTARLFRRRPPRAKAS